MRMGPSWMQLVSYNRDPRELSHSSCHVRMQREDGFYEPGSRSHQTLNLTLDLPASEL